ncbi:UNVERIFIED_CONTAM: hypothetical protein GTU68_012761 [Idotea baltica]|nr:hypothetical protein [Idotea baltica]
MGLYEPAEGRVDVGGFDVRQLDPAELRGKIGFMGQESTLFYGKLRANLTMGEPWADDGKIWASLKRAGLYEFVKSHPEGLDLMIHEGGTSLSGGQRQAICLARALLSEPELLIFDEPTSAMDGLTEKGFVSRVDAYLKEKEGRTLIMATHKSSMLGLVDRVVVVDQGQIVNDGERDRVVAKKSAEKEERTHLKPVAA